MANTDNPAGGLSNKNTSDRPDNPREPQGEPRDEDQLIQHDSPGEVMPNPKGYGY